MVKLTNDTKVKVCQAIIYLSVCFVPLYFDVVLFISGIILGWFLWLFGVSMSLHKWASHKTFVPKSKLIKHFLLVCSVFCTAGSTICWADTHRLHHMKADHEGDPHRPYGNLWNKIKNNFFYFPPYEVSIRRVKDLTNDADHRLYHRLYFRIWSAAGVFLMILEPLLFLYLFVLPIAYVLLGLMWVTTVAHIPAFGSLSYRLYSTDDYTYNSYLWSILSPGEGLHNTHHACPALWNNAQLPSEFDISAQFIKILGIPINQNNKPFSKVTRGWRLRYEFKRVHNRLSEV